MNRVWSFKEIAKTLLLSFLVAIIQSMKYKTLLFDLDGALNIFNLCEKKYRLAAVTNGIGDVQRSRIKNAGIDTCWINSNGNIQNDINPTFTMSDISKLMETLTK